MQKKELRRRLVAALRSGQYHQGRGWLKQGEGDDARYCCLGVACEVALGCGAVDDPDHVRQELRDNAALPPSVRAAFGFRTRYGHFGRRVSGHYSLAGMNDSGVSFNRIAAVIESPPLGLYETWFHRARRVCRRLLSRITS